MTIDPRNPTDYKRTPRQLEEFALYATMLRVATPQQAARRLESLLANAGLALGSDLSPFEVVRVMVGNGSLDRVLRRYGTDSAVGLARCWTELVALKKADNRGGSSYLVGVNLRHTAELEKVFGIGPQLADFIVSHSVERYEARKKVAA